MANKMISLKFNLREDYKYPFFLIALAAFLFLPSIFGGSESGIDLLTSFLFILFIISSLTLIRTESRIALILTYLVAVIGIGFEIYNNFFGALNSQLQTLYRLLLFAYFLTLFVELIKQIFSSKQITLNVVLGAFTGYILIGIIGFFILRIIFILDPSSFALGQESAGDLFYFAFITLTTIGYGDISPLSEAARNFALIMGLTGQFYNSIIIAIIIGKFLQK